MVLSAALRFRRIKTEYSPASAVRRSFATLTRAVSALCKALESDWIFQKCNYDLDNILVIIFFNCKLNEIRNQDWVFKKRPNYCLKL